MEKLYCLTFYTQSNGTYRDGFHIGLFRTYDEAKSVENHYRQEITGFRDYECDAEISEVPVIGDAMDVVCVYRYTGWNVNEEFDEVDIVDSDCYTDYAQAEKDYHEAQATLQREEWALNRHVIGQCDWKEGFVRCYG